MTGSLEGGQQTGSLEGGQHPEVGTRFEGLFGVRDRLACVVLAADRVLDVPHPLQVAAEFLLVLGLERVDVVLEDGCLVRDVA